VDGYLLWSPHHALPGLPGIGSIRGWRSQSLLVTPSCRLCRCQRLVTRGPMSVSARGLNGVSVDGGGGYDDREG